MHNICFLKSKDCALLIFDGEKQEKLERIPLTNYIHGSDISSHQEFKELLKTAYIQKGVHADRLESNAEGVTLGLGGATPRGLPSA